MTHPNSNSATLQISGANFPYRQFVLGAPAPISFFYIFHRFGRPLTGAILAIGWSLSLFAITYWRARRIELTGGIVFLSVR